MAWLKYIYEIIMALPTLIRAWIAWEESQARRKQDEIEKQKKDQIDQGVKDHNTIPIEEAIGKPEPGSPANPRDGVKVRPSKDHPQ